jgi:hypothetical protein
MPAKRCPLCHRITAAYAWQCACGYEFGHSAEAVRAVLRSRQTSALIALILLTVLGAAAVTGLVHAAIHGFIVLSALGFTAVILVTARAVHTLRLVRTRLRALDRRAAVPRAIIYRR